MDALPIKCVRFDSPTEYANTWHAMQAFTRQRDATTPDELWFIEHLPVFTLGLAGKAEHLREATRIPVQKIDRGGQITYHGPGQAIVYTLIDLQRRKLKVREFVWILEEALIHTLQKLGITGKRRTGAPGVYVEDAKIAALGLRVTRGCCYHGLALNVDMDLTPFSAIDPCGYKGLAVTQLRDLGITENLANIQQRLSEDLSRLIDQHPIQPALTK